MRLRLVLASQRPAALPRAVAAGPAKMTIAGGAAPASVAMCGLVLVPLFVRVRLTRMPFLCSHAEGLATPWDGPHP